MGNCCWCPDINKPRVTEPEETIDPPIDEIQEGFYRTDYYYPHGDYFISDELTSVYKNYTKASQILQGGRFKSDEEQNAIFKKMITEIRERQARHKTKVNENGKPLYILYAIESEDGLFHANGQICYSYKRDIFVTDGVTSYPVKSKYIDLWFEDMIFEYEIAAAMRKETTSAVDNLVADPVKHCDAAIPLCTLPPAPTFYNIKNTM
jgi:hypothetical protein